MSHTEDVDESEEEMVNMKHEITHQENRQNGQNGASCFTFQGKNLKSIIYLEVVCCCLYCVARYRMRRVHRSHKCHQMLAVF